MDATQAADDARAARFTDVFRAHHGHVAAYARRRLGPELAQDAVADTFTTAWRRFDDLTGDPLPWLYAIAAHSVANQRRAWSRRTRLDDRARTVLHRGQHQPDHADEVVETDALSRAFRELSESDREALRLTTWEGLGPAAAAVVVGCSRATFTVRVHRARRRLLALLADEEPDLPAQPSRAVAARSEETS